MRVAIAGAGPAGLYLALLLKSSQPAWTVDVYEQNAPDATYGFGIVLDHRGLARMRAAHAPSAASIEAAAYITRHRILRHRETSIFIDEESYGAAIARLRLLQILGDYCARAGVAVHYGSRIASIGDMGAAGLIVGADGVNSAVRRSLETAFGTTRRTLTNRLAWYGTKTHFAYPILSFKTTERGHFVAVAYPYSENASTFVAECDEDAWERGGVGCMTERERVAFTEALFADELTGGALISNNSAWRALPVVRNERWFTGNTVLIGDALYSAHPSIGSGTRIAIEDAIALAAALIRHAPDVTRALEAFQTERSPGRHKLLDAMDKSIAWYENIGERLDALEPVALVFDFLARTGRITHARLQAEFPRFMARYG